MHGDINARPCPAITGSRVFYPRESSQYILRFKNRTGHMPGEVQLLLADERESMSQLSKKKKDSPRGLFFRKITIRNGKIFIEQTMFQLIRRKKHPSLSPHLEDALTFDVIQPRSIEGTRLTTTV